MRDIAVISRKIYTAGKNFTRPPVVTVATNLNFAVRVLKAPDTPTIFQDCRQCENRRSKTRSLRFANLSLQYWPWKGNELLKGVLNGWFKCGNAFLCENMFWGGFLPGGHHWLALWLSLGVIYESRQQSRDPNRASICSALLGAGGSRGDGSD